MRIAQVLTLHSADGAYGGPVAVARGQVRELARRGHDVTLFAGWDGVADFDAGGAAVRAFPVRQAIPGAGHAGLAAPGLRAALARERFDVVHVHLGRDLVSMPAARAARGRLVLQTHGMVVADDRLRTRVFDRLLTRDVLHRASAILTLTDAERAGLAAMGAPAESIVELPNGIERSVVHTVEPARPTVLFCARLHPRKRVGAFVAMAREIVARGHGDVRFVVAGPDHGDLAALRAATAVAPGVDIEYVGAVAPADVPALLAEATVFVLPSVDEPYPMTVLESLAVGTPAVVTDTCGIAGLLGSLGAADVTDGTPEHLADAVCSLLTSRERRSARRRAGEAAVRTRFALSAVVDDLEIAYTANTSTRSPQVSPEVPIQVARP